ncbi:hypothetical protein [Methylomonas koyamae]|nr:hypothetical protein [Methylomonas koyamae]BBL56978.1 hypothetical protein MKFW12EY_05910 [Methylomonas koyamae]
MSDELKRVMAAFAKPSKPTKQSKKSDAEKLAEAIKKLKNV